jgi:hypothetical protein
LATLERRNCNFKIQKVNHLEIKNELSSSSAKKFVLFIDVFSCHSQMDFIWLSWRLIVPWILFTNDLSTELKSSDPLTDSASFVARDNKPPPTKVISSLQYGKVCVNIYDSFQTTLNNKKIYFYSPIALLNPLDVTSVANQVSATQGNLSISFTIWNQTVTDKVAQHLTQFLNKEVEANQVKVYPFDSVRLTSKVQSVDFSLTNEWQTFDKTRTKIRLSLTCPTKQDCDQVKNRIRRDELKHLRLEFNPKLNDGTFVGIFLNFKLIIK